MSSEPDETDKKILSILLRNATTSKSHIAKRIGIAQSAISERIKKLQETGLIQRYEARLSASDLGVRMLAYVFITERKPTDGIDTGAALAKVTGVEEVHKIAGDDCFLVKIRAADTEELGRILDTEVSPIRAVAGTRTTIVLRTIKEDVALGGIPMFQDENAR
jgi:Lrp/AsnC family leucine-responsive transcriptional regulator